MKANYNHSILTTLKNLGVGIDAVSPEVVVENEGTSLSRRRLTSRQLVDLIWSESPDINRAIN